MVKESSNQVWELEEFGLENLQLRDRSIPEPGKNEVLVKVAAVSVNYRDVLVAGGGLLPYPPEMPFTPLSDMCGYVAAIGEDVSGFDVGERVISHFRTTWLDDDDFPDDGGYDRTLGAPLPGVLSKYCVVPETGIVKAPESLTEIEASTLPIAGLTAWSALQEIGCLKPGTWVVAQGTGGVALSALKIAKTYGVKVALTSRSPQKFKNAYREGADFIIDTSSENEWSGKFLMHTKGRPAAQVLELIGGDNLKESLAVLGHGGQLHSIGFLESRYAEVDLIPLNVKKISINGISVGHRKALQRFVEAVDSRGIKPVVAQVFGFSQAPEAFDAMKKGAFGNVVINVEG